MTIYKFDLPAAFGPFAIPMPRGADILHVAEQNDSGMMWAKVDPNAKNEHRDFVSVPTGGEPPKDGLHLGTYATLGGRLVFHIFEV